jgi:hypothetical protein
VDLDTFAVEQTQLAPSGCIGISALVLPGHRSYRRGENGLAFVVNRDERKIRGVGILAFSCEQVLPCYAHSYFKRRPKHAVDGCFEDYNISL